MAILCMVTNTFVHSIVSSHAVCRWQWPFQRVTIISMAPRNFAFTLHCISKDMVPFDLPVVFTIGPFDPRIGEGDEGDISEVRSHFITYASKMSAMTDQELREVVLGVIHGQTRLYAAGLTVLEMFGERDSFKFHVQVGTRCSSARIERGARQL